MVRARLRPGPSSTPTRGARSRAAEVLPAVAVLAACVAAWEAWVRLRDTPDYILPAPSAIARRFATDYALVWEHTRTTLTEAVVGFVVGAAVGVVVAVVMAVFPFARRVLSPILVATQTVPMIIMAPLLVLWFGFGLTPKVLVVALVTFFPVAVAMTGGLTVVDGALVDLVRVGGASRWQELRVVRIPHAVPALFDGLRIAAAYTVAAAVVGEWTGASSGLGVYIARSQASFRVDQVFVAVCIVAALSAGLFGLLTVAARVAMPWRADDRSTS